MGEALVQPQTLKGFQDLLPEDATVRNTVIAALRGVMERYGYLPIETPAMEYLATLVGSAGDETTKQIFRLKSPENDDIALRFDLTVPFARVLAQYHHELKLPFRRYHVAPVWRADKPGPGRFRQFLQFDFDAAGSTAMALDAEVIKVLAEVMDALGVTGYQIKLSHRKVVDALLARCGLTEERTAKHVLRVIDKLDKVGLEKIRLELGPGRVDESGDPIPGVGLTVEQIDAIAAFLGLGGGTRREVLDRVAAYLGDAAGAAAALAEVEELFAALEALGVDETHCVFDPSLARGLEYYTGPVFETVLTAAPQFGSVMGGGRYDGLVRRFQGEALPATGGSVGVDRLLAALKHIGALDEHPKTTTQVMVTVFDKKLMGEYLKLAGELRAAGLNVEVYFGRKKDGLGTQLSLANSRGIAVAVILGGDELARGEVAVKDLREGQREREGIADREEYRQAGKSGQVTVARTALIDTVKAMLARD